MKTLIAMTLLLALGLVFPTIAADKDDLEHLENRVKQLNALGAKPEMQNIAFQRISTETGMPVENVKRQHEQHPNVGVGGLMIANVIANDTKKSPGTYLTQRDNGKKWLQIAKENNVSVDKLNERLDRLHKAIKGDNKT